MKKIISIERLTAMTNLVIIDNGKSYKYSNRKLVELISDENISIENAFEIYNYFITTNVNTYGITTYKFSRPLVIEAKTRWKTREALAKINRA